MCCFRTHTYSIAESLKITLLKYEERSLIDDARAASSPGRKVQARNLLIFFQFSSAEKKMKKDRKRLAMVRNADYIVVTGTEYTETQNRRIK